MMAIGTLGAMGSGASFPLMMWFFTGIIDSFTAYGQTQNMCFNVT
jgi:hypothetical protein